MGIEPRAQFGLRELTSPDLIGHGLFRKAPSAIPFERAGRTSPHLKLALDIETIMVHKLNGE
jgi:hypothetical protein